MFGVARGIVFVQGMHSIQKQIDNLEAQREKHRKMQDNNIEKASRIPRDITSIAEIVEDTNVLKIENKKG